MKETKKDRKCKDSLCLCTGRVNIIRMPERPKVICRFIVIPINIPMTETMIGLMAVRWHTI